MSNRIVGLNGLPAGDDSTPPTKAPSMQERLVTASDDWNKHRKDKAFVGALNAIASLSNIICEMGRMCDRIQKENLALHVRLQKLEKAKEDESS